MTLTVPPPVERLEIKAKHTDIFKTSGAQRICSKQHCYCKAGFLTQGSTGNTGKVSDRLID